MIQDMLAEGIIQPSTSLTLPQLCWLKRKMELGGFALTTGL
jgi:hypothetical protein